MRPSNVVFLEKLLPGVSKNIFVVEKLENGITSVSVTCRGLSSILRIVTGWPTTTKTGKTTRT